MLVRLEGVVSGATTYPQLLLGVLSGATVMGAKAGRGALPGTALATTLLNVEALFVVTGLASGTSQVWDAAYGVETAVAATALRYGGPNDATAGTAFGGLSYEVWDTA